MDPAVLSIRLLALLEKVPARAGKEDVHKLRTSVRRLEVQLGDAPPEKVSKTLKSLRKEAGKVRDIDVHLGLLKTTLVATTAERAGEEAARKKLRQILKSNRDRHVRLLRETVAEAIPQLKTKLPAIAEHAGRGEISAQEAFRRRQQARNHYLQWTRRIPEDPERLHRLRIETKKLRYSLEALEGHPECAEMAEKLKQVQDAVGSWHDWATLREFAERELKADDAKLLNGPLRARTEREYRKARRAAASVRMWMTGGKPVASVAGEDRSERMMLKAG